jgi:hypothetical protein
MLRMFNPDDTIEIQNYFTGEKRSQFKRPYL